MADERIKLSGSPEGSTSWVYVTEDGSLVVEFYDYGEARDHFGTDVAFLVTVPPAWKPQVLERLDVVVDYSDRTLLDRLAERFGSYFEIKAWLEAERIPFHHEFDSWA